MISILNFTQGQSRAVIYIGAFLFGGVFAFGSDLLLFRSGQRALKSRSNIEINKLMDMPECDIYWSPEEFLKKEAYEEFLTRAARHASEHISDDTKEYQVWLVPAHGSEARGWPFVSHKASTTVHVFRYAKNGGVLEAKSQFEVCQTNHDSFSLLGMLGNWIFGTFCSLPIIRSFGWIALSLQQWAMQRRHGFPVIVDEPRNAEYDPRTARD